MVNAVCLLENKQAEKNKVVTSIKVVLLTHKTLLRYQTDHFPQSLVRQEKKTCTDLYKSRHSGSLMLWSIHVWVNTMPIGKDMSSGLGKRLRKLGEGYKKRDYSQGQNIYHQTDDLTSGRGCPKKQIYHKVRGTAPQSLQASLSSHPFIISTRFNPN